MEHHGHCLTRLGFQQDGWAVDVVIPVGGIWRKLTPHKFCQ
jgi:hypothetical protein